MSGRGRAKKAKLGDVLSWIEGALDVKSFDDVSNNGLQIARDGEEVSLVAFAVDGSAASVKAAAEAGAQLLVVHHGISWGGGIRRIVEGDYAVVKAAMDANVALAAYHLPLDANRKYGNNWELARYLGLRRVAPAFTYGEASWGERIAARNVGMPMVCAGHYETETFGVKALARGVSAALGVATVFVGE